MTNTELIAKIKAEIDRRMLELAKDKYIDLHDTLCRTKELNLLLSFLSTLEEEIPTDLEEAANNHIREVVDAAGHPGWEWETRDIKDAFIAGAEWQKEQKPAEWSEEDEEMLEYVIGDVNEAKQLFATKKDAIDLCDKEIAWLKSLRPSWTGRG